MFKYYSSSPFKLEVNTDLKIGRILLDIDHIMDLTPNTVVVYHPELFHSIDEAISSYSSIKFEFTCSWYEFQSKNSVDFHDILKFIDIFKKLIQ